MFDTASDVDRERAARERSEATIASVNATLERPRPEGEPWRLPDPEPRKAATVPSSAPAPAPRAPEPARRMSRETRATFEVYEAAIGGVLGRIRREMQEQIATVEVKALVRLDVLEARLAALEARAAKSRRRRGKS